MNPPDCVVLHVEDDANDRLFTASAFRKVAPAVQLVQIADGQLAIDYLSRNSTPQLILLDLKLPRKSGLEILEWVRGNPDLASLPVVILSSSYDPSDVERATRSGATAYLVKSIELPELREQVRRVVELACPPQPVRPA